jgi:hypothetical protein
MTFVSDLKGALRLWRRRPAMPILTIAFLGCGMGAAAGVFAVADAMVWRDLPLPRATRIVWVQSVDRGQPGDTAPGLVQA